MTADGGGIASDAPPPGRAARCTPQFQGAVPTCYDVLSDGIPDAQPRHYPVDVPTPFERYHHRLSARDIMVHRIMSDLMKPSRVPVDVYNAYVSHPARFDAFRNERMRTDCQCLQKMLFTSYDKEPPPAAQPLRYLPLRSCSRIGCNACGFAFLSAVEGPRNRPPTMEEQTLDLVRRHYLERDSGVLRAWIAHLAPSPHPSGNRDTHISDPRSLGYFMFRGAGAHPLFIVTLGPERQPTKPNIRWKAKDTANLKSIDRVLQRRGQLYDGGTFLPQLRREMDEKGISGSRRGYADMPTFGVFRLSDQYFSTAWPEEGSTMRFIIQRPWELRDMQESELAYGHPFADRPLDLTLNNGRGPRARNHRKRCTSEPPPGSFTSAYIGTRVDGIPSPGLEVIFPRMPLSELDRRSRRRSLSRRNIHDMFDWNTAAVGRSSSPSPTDGHSKTNAAPPRFWTCENCLSPSHRTANCTRPCGWCGAPNPNRDHREAYAELVYQEDGSRLTKRNFVQIDEYKRHENPHLAHECPVARHNRCKCMPFPVYHVADRCGIPCRRDCGAAEKPGTFRHHNAVLCTARCCMCGLKGHSGKDCRLRKCRCGGQHLGQDCTWNPACRVKGCGRFLCGLHCRSCGSSEKPFVQWKCGKCVSKEGIEPEKAEKRGRPRKRRPRKGEVRNDEQKKEDGTMSDKAAGDLSVPAEVPSLEAAPELPPSIFGGPRVVREVPNRDK